ncbi:hypothetical protein BJV77DRAFT_670676 [Russula vinacea]|nr:hypothetical protein BJV77DRAFT_670676 [Russula vinacea]
MQKVPEFASMSAIVAALQSIPQLILTRETKLTKSEKRLLSQLDEVLAPQGDHRAYREALQNGESPFVVPWLAVHLRTLQTFYARTSPTVVVDQRPQINFNRCAKLLERVDDIGDIANRRRRPPRRHRPRHRHRHRHFHLTHHRAKPRPRTTGPRPRTRTRTGAAAAQRRPRPLRPRSPGSKRS